jgi:hypothetical protein
MKFLVLLFVSLNLFAIPPEQKEIPVQHIYIPFGFDANDNIELIVEGKLPNLCHRSPMTKLKVQEQKISIKMTSLYYSSDDTRCPGTQIPVMETVALGLLKAGNYKIIVNEGSQYEKTTEMKVGAVSTTTPDDVIYANVESVEVVPRTRIVKLKGTNPSDCFEFQELKTYSNGVDAYSILPIVKKISDDCTYEPKSFSYDFQVPNDLAREKVLLHIRSMRGKSVNFLYRNRLN